MPDDPYKVAYPITPFANVEPFNGTVQEFAEMMESARKADMQAIAASVAAFVNGASKVFEKCPPSDFYRWN